MVQRLPSTQALRALESFSRLGKISDTAEELHLTRSAISHQLRLLERDLGFKLFNRVGTRIELNSKGWAYAKDVRKALEIVADSASRNADLGLTGELTISCTPGFAATWLSTKITHFREMYPEIDLHVVTPKQLDDVSNPNVDLFVAFGYGNMGSENTELLKEVEFTPLISPVLLNKIGGLAAPSDIARAEFLHLANREDWKAWLPLAGLPLDMARGGTVFSDMNLVFSAAVNSQGISMGDEFICHQAMHSGRLVRPFEIAIKSPKSYFLFIPPSKCEFVSVVAFRNWILGEIPRRRL